MKTDIIILSIDVSLDFNISKNQVKYLLKTYLEETAADEFIINNVDFIMEDITDCGRDGVKVSCKCCGAIKKT